jgi:hypothetical protein
MMNKTEAIMRLMETVAPTGAIYKLPIYVDVGWTRREKMRRVLPRLLRDCVALGVEGTFEEEKRLFKSTFNIVLVGTVQNLNTCARVWETYLKVAWHDDDPS